ncbi:MAG: NYN domain-containing protein [Candidatus Shapirobacteria bacterium]
MNKTEIKNFLNQLSKTLDRNIVIVDFANVDRWQDSTDWPISVNKLGQLNKYISQGKKYLRRFYYGMDFGPKDSSKLLLPWSEKILKQAQYSGFEIVSKRVKYIPDDKYETGFIKKCNLDIEMAVDLIKEQENYDIAVIFSGDGDMAYVCEYIHNIYNKTIYIFGARNHIGKELIDAKSAGIIKDILFVEDFEYRLNLNRR